MGRSFTVRKMSSGIGVERTFPFTSPAIDKVELFSRGKVRRGRLYFLRGLKGRAARLTSSMVFSDGRSARATVEAAAEAAPTPEAKTDETSKTAETPKTSKE